MTAETRPSETLVPDILMSHHLIPAPELCPGQSGGPVVASKSRDMTLDQTGLDVAANVNLADLLQLPSDTAIEYRA